jgi:general secretion pathway protein A
MYCEFYGFKEMPFTITPNPRFIFLSKNHKEVFAHLLYGIRNHSGFIEVSGEVGTGKTTVLRTLLNQLHDDAYRLAFIFNPSLSAIDLLRSINREFGIPDEPANSTVLLANLNAFLLRENAAGKTVVLVIDEAQNLEPGVLEQIRLLSNLETETEKLIQIVLVGQPELGRMLSQPELRQVSQRITVRYDLHPMDFDDTRAYIEHRLAIAGCADPKIFTPGSVKKIYRFSKGFPRLINIVCDRALLVGYTEDVQKISASVLDTAIRELRRENMNRNPRNFFWAAAFSVVVLFILAGITLSILPGPAKDVAPVKVPIAEDPLPAVAAAAVPTPDPSPDRIAALRQDLAEIQEKESAVLAFNALAKIWDVPGIRAGSNFPEDGGMVEAAADRKLKLASFSGDLGTLEKLDSPALLELILPGVVGKRYLALVGVGKSGLAIAPPLEGKHVLNQAELESIWFGRAYIPWKNYSRITYLSDPGTRGEDVARLQNMLRNAGFFDGEPTGVYDRPTIMAVTDFQNSRQVDPDGRVGPQTLLLLYQADPKLSTPRLHDWAPGGER